MTTTFTEWTSERSLATIGTNAGSLVIPFQNWKPFKEAFAPELIREAFDAMPAQPKKVLDPFGGSGTTALACQFLGAHPVTAEVNPFLADVIEAKLTSYDGDALRSSLKFLLAAAPQVRSAVRTLPPTLVEPGVKGRFVYSAAIAEAFFQLKDSIDQLAEPSHRRFFTVMLSALLIPLSNVRISGKGRRYRSNWSRATHTASEVFSKFEAHCNSCIAEAGRFAGRAQTSYEVLRGDSRTLEYGAADVDLAIFSPPYPNSFDYTDVYNLELWMLGYLKNNSDNTALRETTLSSHVQIKREFERSPEGSNQLANALAALQAGRPSLWNKNIPEMVAGYFADLLKVTLRSAASLKSGGELVMVVGDSRYSSVEIKVAEIMRELMSDSDLRCVEVRPFRSMRSSPQQGGKQELAESLLRFRKN